MIQLRSVPSSLSCSSGSGDGCSSTEVTEVLNELYRGSRPQDLLRSVPCQIIRRYNEGRLFVGRDSRTTDKGTAVEKGSPLSWGSILTNDIQPMYFHHWIFIFPIFTFSVYIYFSFGHVFLFRRFQHLLKAS
jgi:hypothetical protein